MELMDGVRNQQPQPQVVMGALENMGSGTSKMLGMVGAFFSNPTTNIVQTNNTVFAYNASQKDEEHVAVSYVYNLDLLENYPKNIYNFLNRMQGRGMTSVVFTAKDPSFLQAFLKIIPDLKKRGSRGAIAESKTKKVFIARVIFGKKPLEKKKNK
tara:strand:+ start:3599 stop:4063 length:465 start_codon:yes stop_codon:yes gene_type:complete